MNRPKYKKALKGSSPFRRVHAISVSLMLIKTWNLNTFIKTQEITSHMCPKVATTAIKIIYWLTKFWDFLPKFLIFISIENYWILFWTKLISCISPQLMVYAKKLY